MNLLFGTRFFNKLSLLFVVLSVFIPQNVFATGYVHYTYKISKGGIIRSYGIKVLKNGNIYYLSGLATGSAKKVELPKNRAFSSKIFDLLAKSIQGEEYHVPCGAPRMGTLKYNINGEDKTVELSNPYIYAKYGVLTRALERRLSPLYPKPVVSDCMPLSLPPKNREKLLKPDEYEKYIETYPPRSPFKYLNKILNTSDPDSVPEYLGKIVFTEGSDPFFGKYLIKNFRLTSEAGNMLKYHAASLVYSVSDCREAGRVLKLIRRSRGLEKYYFSMLLHLACNDFEKAAKKAGIYFKGIGHKKEGEKLASSILYIRSAMGQLNYGGTTWTNQIITISKIFSFWHKLAMMIDLPDIQAFPLAKLFYLKAFHYARMFAGNLKVGAVPLTPFGRKMLPDLFSIAISKPWWTRTPEIQYDIMSLITMFRLKPEYFGGLKVISSIMPPLDLRIYELIKMRRLKTADKLIEKYGKNTDMIRLEYAKGRALFETEKYDLAFEAFKSSADSGNSGLYHLVRFMKNGLNAEEEQFNDPDVLWASLKYLRTYEQNEKLKKVLNTVKVQYKNMPDSLKFEYVKSALVAGKNYKLNLKRLYELAKLKVKEGTEAGMILAEMFIASGSSWEAVYNRVKTYLYGKSGAKAWGLLTLSAVKLNKQNTDLLAEKSRDAALKNPEQLIDLIELYVRYGIKPGLAWELSQKALTLYQDSSKLAYLRAILLFRSDKLFDALFESYIALNKRPDFTPYKYLSTEIYNTFFSSDR